jgi:hypothetical protein
LNRWVFPVSTAIGRRLPNIKHIVVNHLLIFCWNPSF